MKHTHHDFLEVELYCSIFQNNTHLESSLYIIHSTFKAKIKIKVARCIFRIFFNVPLILFSMGHHWSGFNFGYNYLNWRTDKWKAIYEAIENIH